MKPGYIKKEDRKTILIIADDCRLPSGVGTMTKELIVGNAHRFNIVHLGAGVNHPEMGKIMDLCESINKEAGIDDASVYVYPYNGYGDRQMLSTIMSRHKMDGIVLFTDPRYYAWLYELSAEIRQTMPIAYYHIWDDLPVPYYNKPFYESCDLLMGISKQSTNISEMVLGKDSFVQLTDKTTPTQIAKSLPKTCNIPHGVNPEMFKPLPREDKDVQDMRKHLFGDSDPSLVFLVNNRNIHRKMISDVIVAYKVFCEYHNTDRAKTSRLVLHTNPSDENGTNLVEVIDTLCPELKDNIKFTMMQFDQTRMNALYNSCDVVVNVASNEGWGLSNTEAMMAGRMTITNVTGGLQDQMNFTDLRGKPMKFDFNFTTNHTGTLRDHGEWVIPVWPASINLQGSIKTPYIFDDRCNIMDISEAMIKASDIEPEERLERGLAGREWACSDQAKMTSAHMTETFGKRMTQLLDNWVAIDRFKVYNVEEQLALLTNRPTGIML